MPDPHIGTGLSSSVETEGTVGKVVYKPYYTLENSEGFCNLYSPTIL